MDIIVANIAPSTRKKDLQEFFQDFAKDATFEVVRLKGKFDVVVFGHVYIPKDRVAAKAIRKLNLKVLNGRRALVREFQVRAGNHERRALGWRNKPWPKPERRRNERRTPRVNIKQEDPVIEGYMTFARKSL